MNGVENRLSDAIEKKYNITVRHEICVGSTNEVAKKAAQNGENTPLLVIADNQTDGKGRGEHKFLSYENCGLYMTLALKPKITGSDIPLVTTAAAVAVSEAIDTISGKKTGIKWVNDIFLSGKKICGILTEAAFSNNAYPDYIVAGIGINLTEPKTGFEDEIKAIAGAVFEECDENLKIKLAAEVINRFMGYLDELSQKTFLPKYREKCFILGKSINVIKPEGSFPAAAESIGDDLSLKVKYPNGEKERLISGEVSIRF